MFVPFSKIKKSIRNTQISKSISGTTSDQNVSKGLQGFQTMDPDPSMSREINKMGRDKQTKKKTQVKVKRRI